MVLIVARIDFFTPEEAVLLLRRHFPYRIDCNHLCGNPIQYGAIRDWCVDKFGDNAVEVDRYSFEWLIDIDAMHARYGAIFYFKDANAAFEAKMRFY